MPVEKLLSQLRGIPSPPEPGWWPLAAGWWILLGIIALAVIAAIYFRRQKTQLGLYHQADLELQRITNLYLETEDNQALLLSLSAWLRRVCIIAFPEKPIAAITGQAWIEFLDQTLPGSHFTQGVGGVFSGEIYSRQPVVDSNAILRLCHAWLLSMQPGLIAAMQVKHPVVSSC